VAITDLKNLMIGGKLHHVDLNFRIVLGPFTDAKQISMKVSNSFILKLILKR
jgi:hypothetical protein